MVPVVLGVSAVVGVSGYYGIKLIGGDVDRKKSGLKTNIGTQREELLR